MFARLLVVIAMLSAGPAFAAPRCPHPADDWTVVRGDLVAGAACGVFVASSDASDTRFTIGGVFRHFSLARFAYRDPVQVPYEVSFDWQWLTPGRWGLEIHGLGVVVLLGVDTVGFYVDDSQLMGSMFDQFPAWSTTGMRRITVRQTAREVVVLVDGKPIVSVDGHVAGRRAVDAAGKTGTLMLGVRGAPGERTRGALRAATYRSLAPR